MSSLISRFLGFLASFSSHFYVIYLRKKGVAIGEGTSFFGRVLVDVTRPYLLEIGRNCVLTQGVVVLTHGADWSVMRERFGELLASSGKVVIEDNVFIGVNSVILKGVRIGGNCIVGAGSVVTRDIPPNSVAGGNPCRVIMDIGQYYDRRKKEYLNEAKAYALELYRKTGQVPRREDFWVEFPIFLDRDRDWGKLPVREQLGSAFTQFMRSKPVYSSFREFLIDSGIPANKIGSER